ncbi:heavy metal translocating P-type ATPase [Glutamicibacter sp. PS]|uniref:heavy metal translocating P-type ATPase n=1 Tax=Glutamicibacter sp. PS TaxID=3075634 RepID=UPI0028484202|nr:heavy metal translocating P-type ATPase [Glutamicibacter sp. PS]MDR4534358.1 heavy metal translocating P-type ATPase [Glutamicibacter sp. PS]
MSTHSNHSDHGGTNDHGGSTRTVNLDIQGMTCASCVNRVERKLGKLPGVSAAVNLPLNSAAVEAPADISDEKLIDAVQAAGYSANVKQPSRHDEHGHHGDHEHLVPDHLLRRLIVSAIFTVPLFIISMVPAAQFANWGWVALALATPVVFYGAWPFHKAAAVNARHLASTMDTLVSIGVLAAYLFSLFELLRNPQMTALTGMSMSEHALYFETAAVVATFLLLGRYLESRAKDRASDALKSLLSLGAKEAVVLREGREERIPADQLVPDDIFVVRPGEKIATDGVVTEGTSAVDSSLITGESVPQSVGPDDEVIGATINTSGRLLVRATRVGSDTTLAQMGRLVSEAQSGKAPIARLADRISAVFVPIVLAVAVLTFAAWLIFGGELLRAFAAAVAVLVIACPCALGLATPIGLLVGTGRGAQLGILIRGPQVLEDTRRLDTVVVDKTGTVTTGDMGFSGLTTVNSFSEDTVLALAAAVEHHSEHPIARAIASAGAAAGQLPEASDFHSDAGGGVRATVKGQRVVVGRRSWLAENGTELDQAGTELLESAEAAGATAILVAVDGEFAGVISVADTIKDSSAPAIAALRERGLRVVLLTGDNQQVATQVASKVGIDAADVRAGVLPAQKVDAIRELQQSGGVVAMVGDGVNDAPALAQADLGIAMGSGTDVAIEAADITLMGNSLEQVVQGIDLSAATLRTIKMNLFWAFAYNTAGIPIAALGLLNPMIAGAAMAASSVLVVLNSLRLRSFGKK